MSRDQNQNFQGVRLFLNLSQSFAVNRCQQCDEHAHCNVDRCECDEGYRGDGKVCIRKSFLRLNFSTFMVKLTGQEKSVPSSMIERLFQ